MFRLIGWMFFVDMDEDDKGRTRFTQALSPIRVPTSIRDEYADGLKTGQQHVGVVIPQSVLALHVIAEPAPIKAPSVAISITRDEIEQPIEEWSSEWNSWAVGEAIYDLGLRFTNLQVPFRASGPLKFHIRINDSEIGVAELPMYWDDQI